MAPVTGKSGRYVAGCCVSAVLALLVTWFWGTWYLPGQAGPDGDVGRNTGIPEAGSPPATPFEVVAARLQRDAPPAVLGTLHVLVRNGADAGTGRISLVHGPRLTTLQRALAPFADQREAEPGTVHSNGPVERLDASVPVSHWTWIRVSTTEGLVLFESAAPFSGERTVEIDLARPPAIHLTVLGACHVESRPYAIARVMHLELAAPPQVAPRFLRSVRCDALGMAVLRDLPAGRLLFAAGDAGQHEGAPCVATLLWGGLETKSDTLVVIAERPPLFDVIVTVNVDGDELSSPRPKLYLRRHDDLQQLPVTMQGVLRTGLQEVTFRCPAGAYEANVLPIGACAFDGPRRIDVVESGPAGSLSVAAMPSETRFRLKGPRSRDYPLRVSAHVASGMRDDNPMLFLGPLSWGAEGAWVPVQETELWLSARGRYGPFLSRTPVRWLPGEASVEMVDATCVRLTWGSGMPEGGWPLVMLVQEGEHEWMRPFQRQVVETRAGRVPALAAEVVVPRGNARLSVYVGARAVWQRDVTLAGRCMEWTAACPD